MDHDTSLTDGGEEKVKPEKKPPAIREAILTRLFG